MARGKLSACCSGGALSPRGSGNEARIGARIALGAWRLAGQSLEAFARTAFLAILSTRLVWCRSVVIKCPIAGGQLSNVQHQGTSRRSTSPCAGEGRVRVGLAWLSWWTIILLIRPLISRGLTPSAFITACIIGSDSNSESVGSAHHIPRGMVSVRNGAECMINTSSSRD
jgi:hypothetical protein